MSRRTGWVLAIACVCASCSREPLERAQPPPEPVSAPGAKSVANVPPAPAPVPAGSSALFPWPLPPFTAAQISAARGCGLASNVAARYPKALKPDALAGAFARKTACDEATLAAACAERVDEKTEPPASCVEAFRAAVRANPAFVGLGALTDYYDKVVVVDPPVAGHAIVRVAIDYTWSGLGDAVEWHLRVVDVTSAPKVDASGPDAAGKRDAQQVGKRASALAKALSSFVPIPAVINAEICTDNSPDWKVALEFDNGSRLELATHGSNVLGMGGPWQTTIDGITYMQLAPDLAIAMRDLVRDAALPLGHAMGMTCGGFDLTSAMLGHR
jgi:hypothetical protein